MNLVSVLEGDDRGWQEYANCMGVDPDLFFPERGASTREAKEVCKGCVVREDCLEFALANGEKFGIWGGMSERERRRVRRSRALARRGQRRSAASLVTASATSPEARLFEAGLERLGFAEIQFGPAVAGTASSTSRPMRPTSSARGDRHVGDATSS